MVQLCPRCQRANPARAIFCHFDGQLLRPGGGAPTGQLLQEFVFPSGRRCATFDELARGCHAEWEDARRLLHGGVFTSFLAGVGRADLSRAAAEAQALSDADLALTTFLASLPAGPGAGPKLGLAPHRLVLGPVHVGERRQAQVRVVNEGQGLLQGRLQVADDCPWLRLTDGDGVQTAVKTAREQTIPLYADTAGLVVGQNYSARLVLVTSGGVAELPVRLDLVARPFPSPPYQGAASPHELARRMRDNPHPAVRLLETGEVARWFATNGWTYPIVGVPAPGLAAVQQFFEELGLARAPQILLPDQPLHFRCTPPEIVRGEVTLRSPARKLVYARAESDVPWLKPTAPGVSGQAAATIGFEIDSTLLGEDGSHVGGLRVVANAGQAFHLRVQVEVSGNRRGWFGASRTASAAALPVPEVPPAPVTTRPPPPVVVQLIPAVSVPAAASGSAGRALLVGALLGGLGRLAVVLPADLFARLLAAPVRQPAPGTLSAWLEAPAASDASLRLFVLATWWLGAVAGAWLSWRGGGRRSDLLCGLVAGAVAGVAAAATAGSVLALGDTLPRLLLGLLPGGSRLGAAVATPVWILAATLSWLLWGGLVGLMLALSGPGGRRALDWLSRPLTRGLRQLGLTAIADYLDPRPS